jgi:hypothetical protein
VDSDDPELGRYCAMAKLYATDVAMRVDSTVAVPRTTVMHDDHHNGLGG